MRKNKLLYIFITLVTMFTMGKVDAKECKYSGTEISAQYTIDENANASKVTINGKFKSEDFFHHNDEGYRVIEGEKEKIKNWDEPFYFEYETAGKDSYLKKDLCPKYLVLWDKTGSGLQLFVTDNEKSSFFDEAKKKQGYAIMTLNSTDPKIIKTCTYKSSTNNHNVYYFSNGTAKVAVENGKISNWTNNNNHFKNDQCFKYLISDNGTWKLQDNKIESDGGKNLFVFQLNEGSGSQTSGNSNSCELGQNLTDYNSYKNILENCNNKYTECVKNSNKNCEEYLKIYNSYKQNLTNYCSNILSKADYVEGSDVDLCLSLRDDLKEIEDKRGSTASTDEKCGMSEDMRSFLANIFKWIRYIIPVLVIILGLFDFMRAAASGTEDHMKKAQKQLTTRLIAAALIFLGPLVIAFFLEQFGFVAEGCGIIEL